jgi:hypothetical protein
MSTPTFEQVAMKLKSNGVPFNSTTIQNMCGCGGTKDNATNMSIQKMCGCGGHTPGVTKHTIERKVY